MKILGKFFALLLIVVSLPSKAALDIVITEGVDTARPDCRYAFCLAGNRSCARADRQCRDVGFDPQRHV